MKILTIVLWGISMLIIPIKAQSTATWMSKTYMPYEIFDIRIEEDLMIIEGWALLIENQHFINNSTHEIYVDFVGAKDEFSLQSTLLSITKTSQFEYRGKPFCGANEYFQTTAVCNYEFENIGFQAIVPLSKFKVDERYTVTLTIKALQSQSNHKIQAYYINSEIFIKQIGNVEYLINSGINDSKIIVRFATVLARSGPSTSYPQHKVGSNCSTTYLNNAFFLLDSVYETIYSRQTINYTTHYEIKGAQSICLNNRRRLVEGISVSPLWIASSFVDYTGTPLTILKRAIHDESNTNILSQIRFIHARSVYSIHTNYAYKITQIKNELSNQMPIYSENLR